MWKRWNVNTHIWERSVDNGQTWSPLPFSSIRMSEGYYERARPTPLGYWQNVPFNAANFFATGGTWTVGAPAIIKNRFTLIGLTMFWSFYISWFSGSNTLSGAATGLNLVVPGGFTYPGNDLQIISYAVDGSRVDLDANLNGGTNILINKRNGTPFISGGVPGMISTLIFEVSGAGVDIAE